jgi:hypothetical protein
MRARLILGFVASACLWFGGLEACSSSEPAPAKPTKKDASNVPPEVPPDDDGSVIPPSTTDSGPGSGRVYANTTDTLYLFEPISRKYTRIGAFSCLNPGEAVIDIAVDRVGTMYATTFGRFLKVDPIDATCVEKGVAPVGVNYPNSLSFVPAGTVDPTKEALVGYVQVGLRADQYTRIDTDNGTMTTLGNLNPPSAVVLWSASGDLISLIQASNKTYLTITGDLNDASATDSLAEVDPTTGVLIKVLGNTKQTHIYGLGYWAGKGYGFSDDGRTSEIDITNGSAVIANTLTGDGGPLPWYGAGVTTFAPVN